MKSVKKKLFSEMSFPVPTKQDFRNNKRDYRPLSAEDYLEFIDLSTGSLPVRTNSTQRSMPQVRFSL